MATKMASHEQSAIWGNFWQILDLSKKLLADYEKLVSEREIKKRFPQIETAYIDAIIVHVAKIFSTSGNEPFRLGKFKTICRVELKKEIEKLETEYKDVIGKVVTNRNKLIAHLDEKFYDLCYSENEIERLQQQMVTRMHMSPEEAKAVYASMPRAKDKRNERYSIGDFEEDLPQLKEVLEKLYSIWDRSIPFA